MLHYGGITLRLAFGGITLSECSSYQDMLILHQISCRLGYNCDFYNVYKPKSDKDVFPGILNVVHVVLEWFQN